MNKYVACLLPALLLAASCQSKQEKEPVYVPKSLHLEARIDRSEPVQIIDVERALQNPEPLKLSQIASEIEYYTVGDARYTVTQAIQIPDSNAFLTLNYPRLYYRKPGGEIPSKRYGFKALDYKWNKEMAGQQLFFDKKTTRLYVALSGENKMTRYKQSTDTIPCIGELLPLDTMLKTKGYIYPESLPASYPMDLSQNKLLGFSSTGYTLCRYEEGKGEPAGVTTFNLQGDTLCAFTLNNGELAPRSVTDSVPPFQTAYWNAAQDRMNFMIPYCDTLYQLRDPQTVAPLYAVHYGEQGLDLKAFQKEIEAGKIWMKILYENPKAIFLGLYQKGAPKIVNWLGWEFEYKPTLTHHVVYLKEEKRTVVLPYRQNGLVNDLDNGLPFWPDGHTDDCLYMLLTVTEMRERVNRTDPKVGRKLVNMLDSKKVRERDYVMIVVR